MEKLEKKLPESKELNQKEKVKKFIEQAIKNKKVLMKDVIEFILAGANAVAVGTAHFKDSLASKHIADDLPKELEKLGITDINQLVNKVNFN